MLPLTVFTHSLRRGPKGPIRNRRVPSRHPSKGHDDTRGESRVECHSRAVVAEVVKKWKSPGPAAFAAVCHTCDTCELEYSPLSEIERLGRIPRISALNTTCRDTVFVFGSITRVLRRGDC